MGKYVGFKMAARLVQRVACLCRRNANEKLGFNRKMSIFTRYREPPNGFLFNEKVSLVFGGNDCRPFLRTRISL